MKRKNTTMLLAAASAAAIVLRALARTTLSLSGEGWTCDGAPVSVPHTWNAIDGADGGENPPGTFTSCRASSYLRKAAAYRRRLPDPTPGKRQFVKCDGVSIKARVSVNGVEAGCHAGAFTAFCFEITGLLRESGNVLEIIADNTLDDDVPPVAGDFTMYGGIYRDVWFIETDPVCIDPVTDGADGVSIHACPETGDVLAEVSVLGGTNETQRFHFDSPRLWSPENPAMYALDVEIRQKGSVDSVRAPFGFRKAEFSGGLFALNGRLRKFRGVCRHQDREGKGWAISPEDDFSDAAAIKEMGADSVRMSHYPQSRRFLDACDGLGLMVWCETPLVNEMSMTEAFRSNMLAQAREMVAQLRNHPSIVVWGLFNELYSGSPKEPGTMEPFIRETRDLIRALDPSRPTVCASNQYGNRELNTVADQCAFNVYPGWYDYEPWYSRRLDVSGGDMRDLLSRIREANGKETAGVGEYGASGSVNVHNEPFEVLPFAERDCAEEYQAAFHRCAYAAIRDDPRVWGSFIWQMFDSGSDTQADPHRPGVNAKGLFEFDHATPKDAYWFYKANWRRDLKVLHLVGARRRATDRPATTVMAFCNAGPVELRVNGKSLGTKAPDGSMTAIWDAAPLAPGPNSIKVSCGALSEEAVLLREIR